MKSYKNVDTGVIWTEEELRVNFAQFNDDCRPRYDSFEEYLDESIRKRILEEADTAFYIIEEYLTHTVETRISSDHTREEVIQMADDMWVALPESEKKTCKAFYLALYGEEWDDDRKCWIRGEEVDYYTNIKVEPI